MVTLPFVRLVGMLATIAAFALAQDTRSPNPARLFPCTFLLSLAAIGLLLRCRLSLDGTRAARTRPLVAGMIAPPPISARTARTENGALAFAQSALHDDVCVVLILPAADEFRRMVSQLVV
jgi:hypothetical protein